MISGTTRSTSTARGLEENEEGRLGGPRHIHQVVFLLFTISEKCAVSGQARQGEGVHPTGKGMARRGGKGAINTETAGHQIKLAHAQRKSPDGD